MRNFNFKIPGQLDSRLKAEAERSGLMLSEIVRRAIDEYLERHEEHVERGKPGIHMGMRQHT